MAAHIYLLTTGSALGETLVDGITHCIINSDDGGSDAQKIIEAVAQANAAGIPLPAGYFSTVIDLATNGLLDADTDSIFIASRSRGDVRKIA